MQICDDFLEKLYLLQYECNIILNLCLKIKYYSLLIFLKYLENKINFEIKEISIIYC